LPKLSRPALPQKLPALPLPWCRQSLKARLSGLLEGADDSKIDPDSVSSADAVRAIFAMISEAGPALTFNTAKPGHTLMSIPDHLVDDVKGLIKTLAENEGDEIDNDEIFKALPMSRGDLLKLAGVVHSEPAPGPAPSTDTPVSADKPKPKPMRQFEPGEREVFDNGAFIVLEKIAGSGQLKWGVFDGFGALHAYKRSHDEAVAAALALKGAT
jgi:hypothetical protein